jgi:hypothetical protein
VFVDDLLAFLIAAPFVAPVAIPLQQAAPAAEIRRQRAERLSERELRRQNDRKGEEREQQNRRTGAIQISREQIRDRATDDAAGSEVAGRRLERAERERQQRRRATHEQRGADRLRVFGLDLQTPEVVPREVAEQDRDQPGGVAQQLERHLGQEGADAAGEIRGRVHADAVEEPGGVIRRVADERNQP